MKCILLCAGYATRLFPLTENFPKALLEIGGRPLLDYILDEVNTLDEVSDIYVITNAKYAAHFEEWANKKNNIKPITVINDLTHSNDDRLGAIGDIQYTIDKMQIKDDLLIIAGDNLFSFKLKDVIEFQKKYGTPVVCAQEFTDMELLKGFGVAEIDAENTMINCEEKPEHPKSNLGVWAEYVYPEFVIDMIDTYIKEGNNKDAPGNLVSWLYKKTPVKVFKFEGECFDVGTHESLKKVNELYSKR